MGFNQVYTTGKRLIKGQAPFFSFNVSDRCPVNCDCYWRAQARVKELNDDDVISFFQLKKKEGYVHATLVGGEPYVRPKLLEKITPIMPANWLVTSGTTPLRKLTRTTHFVSIDGKDAETHDKIRGNKGLYDRIHKNIQNAKNTYNKFPLFIHTVLNAQNYTQIEDIISHWYNNGLANGILISTITPLNNINDEHLILEDDKREWVVAELKRLKGIYNDFLSMTEGMIDCLHPNFSMTLTPERCATAKFTNSFDAGGKLIKQCILSEHADCSKCGCIVNALTHPLIKMPPTFETLKTLKHFYQFTTGL